MIGIYKITNPNGKIYIGQSLDISKRWSAYKNLGCKSQRILHRSFLKHGVDKHTFEIICECDISELNENERYYQELFNVVGPDGLNCSLVNTKNKKYVHSEETRLIFSKQRTGRKLTPEWAEKVRINLDKSRGRKSKPESIEKRKQTMIKNDSFKHRPETIEKIRLSNLGKKRTYKRVSSEYTKNLISKNNGKSKSKITLHLLTGIYFDNAKDADLCFGLKYGNVKAKLNGAIKTNDTNLIYA